MAMVINTNVMSLNAQRNLTISQGDQNKAMERLTSGKRINTAADDAAGLQIASGLTSQIKGLNQAMRNASDGVSLVQTAEGALQESTNILQRMRELSIQSANGIFTDGNRDALNAEVSQLKEELTRIADTTTFNGLNILDGSLGSFDLQVGDQANQTIGVDFGSQGFTATDLGSGTSAGIVGTEAAGAATAIAMTGAVTINGQAVTSTAINAATNMDELLTAIETAVSGVDANSFVEATGTTAGDGILGSGESVTIATLLNDGTTTTFSVSGTGSLEELVSAINDKSGGSVSASINDDGKLSLVADDADTVTVTDAAAATGGLNGVTTNATLTLTSESGGDITVDYGAAANATQLGIDERLVAGDITGYASGTTTQLAIGDLEINGVGVGAATTNTIAANVAAINKVSGETGVVASGATVITLNSIDGSEISLDFKDGSEAAIGTILGMQETNIGQGAGDTINDLDISTAAGAQSAIDVIDVALETINDARGEMGAVTNRLNYTVNNLSSVSQAASASRSRIEDADFAQESAALSRAQVLQQAGTAMLAQANAAPQQVLSLLQ